MHTSALPRTNTRENLHRHNPARLRGVTRATTTGEIGISLDSFGHALDVKLSADDALTLTELITESLSGGPQLPDAARS